MFIYRFRMFGIAGAALVAASGYSQNFAFDAPITINNSGVATPYGASVHVSGLTNLVLSVNLRIRGYTHERPDDVGMVLVAPGGQALLVQDGGGGFTPLAPVTYLLSDAGSGPYPDAPPGHGQTYKPAAYYTGDSFPAPGPGLAYNHPGPAGGNSATFASTFSGIDGNGTWNLFVFDFVGGAGGAITDGFVLELTQVPEPGTLAALALGGLALLRRKKR